MSSGAVLSAGTAVPDGGFSSEAERPVQLLTELLSNLKNKNTYSLLLVSTSPQFHLSPLNIFSNEPCAQYIKTSYRVQLSIPLGMI